MSGPATSNNQGDDPLSSDHHHHVDASQARPDYESATATAAAAVSYTPQDDNYHHGNYTAAAAATAAELQHRAERQRMQQQLQQQHELQSQQLQYQQQQHQHQMMQQHHQMHHTSMHPQPHHQPLSHQMVHHSPVAEDFENGILQSRYIENEIIKTFSSKADLIAYVKRSLSQDERCKIVINSSKPKAVYFQCERSGTFRTTVKDPTKRQRVAYTKRSKCGYRLVANLYPPEKDKKKNVKKDPESIDSKLGDSFIPDQMGSSEMWILRMINPLHNHAPEATNAKKKRSKSSRQLVEKPIHGRAQTGPNNGFLNEPLISQAPLHHHMAHIHHDEDVPEMMVGMEAPLHSSAVDPNIDPNVDPSVQAHDHAHLGRGIYRR